MIVASFNVENLFSRAKLLNFRNNDRATPHLTKIGQLEDELRKSTYDKPKILSLYRELENFITIQEDRGKLFTRRQSAITGVKANGKSDWDGEIVFRRESFKEIAREATAKVIRVMKPDVICLVEVESRPMLERFYAETVKTASLRLDYNMCIDGNDNRGIDVGILSRYPIKNIKTHIFDKPSSNSRSQTFSRDCLEIELDLGSGKSLHILGNHFVSKMNGSSSDPRRKMQAQAVKEILKNYDLSRDYVVVAGDFNDTPDSATLAPLISLPGLNDVLELQFPNSVLDRWTYHYKKEEQIDYILISDALKARFKQGGVERRGVFDIEELTNGKVKRFPFIQEYKDSASDHAGVWAEFNL